MELYSILNGSVYSGPIGTRVHPVNHTVILAVDGRWSMGWQLAGGVNLVIPPGTAVRDAHACYEVVVLVTVPDKPRLAPCFLLLPLLPHC